MKITLKNILIKFLDFLINKVNSNAKLKSILHPILIKIPFFNKIMYFRKRQISNSNFAIGPLAHSPKAVNDLTQSGQSYFTNIKNTLDSLKTDANTD
jgi:hypothetical protein